MAWPEWAVRAWEPVAPWFEKIAIWRGYEGELYSLMIWAVGITVYAALVYFFYDKMSEVNAWHSERKPGFFGWLVYAMETTLIFPTMSFLYFVLLAGSLFILAPPSQSTASIFLISMSIVVAVRVTAFFSKGASVDLAKLLPLGLLGVFLVNPDSPTREVIWAHVKDVPKSLALFGRYFVFFLVMEAVMSLGRRIVLKMRDKATLVRSARPVNRAQLAAKVQHKDGSTRSVPVKGAKPREGPASGEGTTFTEVE